VWPADEGLRPGTLLGCRVTDRGPDYVVVRLAGDLSADPPSPAVERVLEEQFVDDGVHRIRLDLRDLESIDLEGVAVLIALLRESDRRGKVLTVERARGSVRAKLQTTGVLRVMGLSNLG
jgi:anti-anti-sigma factor